MGNNTVRHHPFQVVLLTNETELQLELKAKGCVSTRQKNNLKAVTFTYCALRSSAGPAVLANCENEPHNISRLCWMRRKSIIGNFVIRFELKSVYSRNT